MMLLAEPSWHKAAKIVVAPEFPRTKLNATICWVLEDVPAFMTAKVPGVATPEAFTTKGVLVGVFMGVLVKVGVAVFVAKGVLVTVGVGVIVAVFVGIAVATKTIGGLAELAEPPTGWITGVPAIVTPKLVPETLVTPEVPPPPPPPHPGGSGIHTI